MAENILHFGAVKLRLQGVGNLKMKVYSLDDRFEKDLVSLNMDRLPGLEPTRRFNFNAQRARIRFYTDKINDNVRINRVIVYAKPRATSYPM